MSEMRNFLENEKIAQVSAAMIIVEQANKIKALEAKNGELEKELDIASSKFIQSEKDIFGLGQRAKELEKKLEIVSKQFIRMHEIACKGYKYYDDETEQALAAINGEGV